MVAAEELDDTLFSSTMVYEGVTYKGDTSPRDHVDVCLEAWQAVLQVEWVHRFASTLDTIPKNWYVKLELRRGTEVWGEMMKQFIYTFSFEAESPTVDNALQVVMRRIWSEPVAENETEEDEEMKQALACYKLAIEGGDGESDDEELQKLDIIETKGEREVQGPEL